MREPGQHASPGTALWQDALRALDLVKLAHRHAMASDRPSGPALSLRIRSGAGPVRDAYLAILKDFLGDRTPFLRIPASISVDALIGGLDVAATLQAGRPLSERGVLSRATHGVLLVPMAERLPVAQAAILARALDTGTVTDRQGRSHPAHFLLVVLDETRDGEEEMAGGLTDRLVLDICLDGISIHDMKPDGSACSDSQADAASPQPDQLPPIADDALALLAHITGQIADSSLRKLSSAARTARLLARLDDTSEVTAAHLQEALRLCLRIGEIQTTDYTQEDDQAPADPETGTGPPPQSTGETQETPDTQEPAELSLDDLFAEMSVSSETASREIVEALRNPMAGRANAKAKTGKSGARKTGSARGRPIGLTPRPPYDSARPDIAATLRAAIPWQRLRNPDLALHGWKAGMKIHILPSDFRYVRYRHRTESTAIFTVDASGSTALSRLAEAKGAIELLLGDCYVRRDQVALVAFRGREAEVLLEPTRSLVRAKRSLTGLPGGGPTPLANGIQRSLELAAQVRQRGQSPLIVYLTDGNANISLKGEPNRRQAATDARKLAQDGAFRGFQSVFIDIAPRPRPAAQELAKAMQADYCTLPYVSASGVSRIVSRYLAGRA
ncbi:magnesium-chelatase 60 kDa subunit [Roseibium aquae]|uniref:Magnesium-chelatase 60 kDa subunit n=1 Tax=Roseibium aquae TaxID=1323746 RepID=A0A916WVU7_9HYPH|nr:VWA domain-containing protein [Roseibium aquae]GGB33961.1 magnesium-chelatase 60 kDa subunit [Roseibium aquae]